MMRLLSASNEIFIQVQEMYYERFLSSFMQMGCFSFWNCSWSWMVNWSKGKTCVDKWKVNDTSPKKLRLKGLLVVSPYFISQSSFSLPPWVLFLWEVLTRSPLLEVKIQKMEPGPPKMERTHQMELTSSNWKKLAQQTLLNSWPKTKRKLKCRMTQKTAI